MKKTHAALCCVSPDVFVFFGSKEYRRMGS